MKTFLAYKTAPSSGRQIRAASRRGALLTVFNANDPVRSPDRYREEQLVGMAAEGGDAGECAAADLWHEFSDQT